MLGLLDQIRRNDELQSDIRKDSKRLKGLVFNSCGPDRSWCYKRKRDGTPSRCLKSETSLVREAVCLEVKLAVTSENFIETLLVYARAMESLRSCVFAGTPKEVDLVDKFYKLQVQNDILQTDTARSACGTCAAGGYNSWVRSVIIEMRKHFNVSVSTRVQQKSRTDHIRRHGLESPLLMKETDVECFVRALHSGRDPNTTSAEWDILESLCLLQLSVGGRARDIIAFNAIEAVDDTYVRVTNVTKRKRENMNFSIVKPVVLTVFPDTSVFMEEFVKMRKSLFELEVARGTLTNSDLQTVGVLPFVYPCIDYEKQWDKSAQIEQVVQSWTAKMRRFLHRVAKNTQNDIVCSLFCRGKGTHQLRKLYVSCSHRQSGEYMKETAWAQRVLGHTSYDTSLLYTNMIITPNED